MNTLLRRRTMTLDVNEESFYSDFPELTETGVYILTPQTDDTTSTNTFLQIGDEKYPWANGGSLNGVYIAVICEKVSRVFVGNIFFDDRVVLNSVQIPVMSKQPIKLKRCDGRETDEALVTFLVEKL